MIHLLFHRSLRGQGMPVRGNEILNTSLHMEAGHPREILKSPQQQETQEPISLRFKSLPGLLVTISSKQSCYQIKELQLGASGIGYAPCARLRKTFSKLASLKKGLRSFSSGGHKRHPKHQASSTVLLFFWWRADWHLARSLVCQLICPHLICRPETYRILPSSLSAGQQTPPYQLCHKAG